MKRIARILLSITFALFGVMGVPTHALALSASSQHSMTGGMSHGSSAISCANICTIATFKQEKRQDNAPQENDDEPTPAQLQYMERQHPLEALKIAHNVQAKSLVDSEPPPGNVSLSTLYSVFRF